MQKSFELKYHLDFFKQELQKKQNSEYQIVLEPLEEILQFIQGKPISDIKVTQDSLRMICRDFPGNYFALTLLAYCNLFEVPGKTYIDDPVLLLKSALAINKDFVFANYLLGYYYGSYFHPAGWANHNACCMLYRKDVKLGVEHLTLAAQFNYPPAIYELTQIKYGEQCVEFETYEITCLEKLIEGIKKAALARYPKALFNIFRGIGDRHFDMKTRLICLGLAANAGHQEAQYELGQCYEKGEGVAVNLDTALYWYGVCADNPYDMGHNLQIGALFTIAKLYEKRKSSTQDLDLASEHFQRTKQLGFSVLERNKKEYYSAHTYAQKTYVFTRKCIKIDDVLKYCDEAIKRLSRSEALIGLMVSKADVCRSFLLEYKNQEKENFPKVLIGLLIGYLFEDKRSTIPKLIKEESKQGGSCKMEVDDGKSRKRKPDDSDDDNDDAGAVASPSSSNSAKRIKRS